MFNTRLLKTPGIAIALAIAALSGCAASHVMVGEARPPTSPDQVRLYLRAPASRYEEIAMVDASSRGGLAFSSQGKTDVVIDRLRAEAAKLGANGIVLQGAAAVYHKKGEAIAIYVEPVQVASR